MGRSGERTCSMATPDPANWRASHPSPSSGRMATFHAPAACNAVASCATTRSAPPGPSVSIRCAIRKPVTSPRGGITMTGLSRGYRDVRGLDAACVPGRGEHLGSEARVITPRTKDRPCGQPFRALAASHREEGASGQDTHRDHADRHIQDPTAPPAGSQPRGKRASRRDGGIEQIDDGWRVIEVQGAPRDRLGAALDLAYGDRQPGSPEPEVPRAEEVAAHQARKLGLALVHQRARTDDPYVDAKCPRFTLYQLFLQTLAPGVRAKRSRIGRARSPLVLALPRRARRP